MATPSIRINQTGQPAGTPGVSRDNIVIGSELQVTDVANGGGSFSWTYVGPATSVAVPTGLGTNDVRVTPDVAGTYLFFVVHDGTEFSYTTNAVNELISSQGGAAVLLPDGRRIPGEGETDQFDGWQSAMENNIKKVLRVRADGSTVPNGPHTDIDIKGANGITVVGSDAGSGSAVVTVSGTGTLDIAYNGGRTILVDEGPIVLNNPGTSPTLTVSGGYTGLGIHNPTSTLHAVGDMHFQLDPGLAFTIDGRTNPRGITTGAMRQNHTAAIAGTRAFHVDVISAGFDDTKGVVIKHDLAGSSAVINPKGLNLDADITGATNASLDFLNVSKVGDAGTGMTLHALHINEEITPIYHSSGSFTSIEKAWVYDDSLASYTDVTTNFGTTVTDSNIFDAQNDIVYIGNDTTFSTVQVILDTFASGAGIKPTFEYSQGGSVWSPIGTSDNTNGFRENGNLTFVTPGDWATDSVNGTSKYWVRITRTTNTLVTTPIEDTIRYSNPSLYTWSADGDLDVRGVCLAEQPTVPGGTPVTGKGKVWLRNDGALVFTVDTGATVPLDVTTAIATTGANVTVSGSAPPTTGQALVATSPTEATWQDVAAGSADALSTTGAAVTVSGSVPPTAGQALVADSPTTATWQDVAAGAGATTSAQGDYLTVNMSVNKTGLHTIGETIPFDTVYNSRGDLTVDGVTNIGRISGLKAGRTYYIQGMVRLDEAGHIDFAWRDITAAALIGTAGRDAAPTHSLAEGFLNMATAIFTPTVDTEIELEIRGFGNDFTDLKAFTGDSLPASWARVTEIGAVQADVVGGLEFMDIIEVTTDQTTVTFGATGDGAHQRALDGDIDETYVIEYYLPPGGNVRYDLKPNGIGTNQLGAQDFGGQSQGGSEFTSMPLTNSATGRRQFGTAEFHAKSGKERGFHATVADTDGVSQTWQISYSGWWGDTAANVTSLDITATTASAIKTGARFVLYRRTTNNTRATSASTYERNVEAVVAQGTTAEVEYTTGHATYAGCAVGVSVSLNDVVTAGTITVNVKVAGATKLTAVLDTANPTFARDLKNVGVAGVAPGNEIIVGIATSGLTTTGGASPGITVNTTLVNYSLLGVAGGFLGTANTYTKAQVVSPVTLTWGANISMVASDSNVFNVTLTGATAQIDNPTDMVDGQTIVLRAYQDVTGGRGLTFDTAWDFGEDGPPNLTAEAGDKMSIITGVSDGTKIAASAKLGFTP